MMSVSPLVFLHGMGSEANAWAPQVEVFSGTVIAPAFELSIKQAVSALDALKLADADLCGLSWGSLVALRYAIDRPERVSRLILTAGFASLPVHLRLFQYAMSALVQVIPRAPHQLGAPMRECARFDVRRSAESLQTPTLVLCGERDRLNLALSRSLAGLLPNASFETIRPVLATSTSSMSSCRSGSGTGSPSRTRRPRDESSSNGPNRKRSCRWRTVCADYRC